MVWLKVNSGEWYDSLEYLVTPFHLCCDAFTVGVDRPGYDDALKLGR